MYKEILTDPQKHNPNNFIYIVHAINDGSMGKGVNELDIRKRKEKIRTEGAFYCGSLVGKLDLEAARIMFDRYKGNLPISQTDTNGQIGLILDLPDDSVIRIASTSDLNSPGEQGELREFVIRYKIGTDQPLKLLLMSEGAEGGYREYNEMILRGHPLTGISGVFYQDTDSETEARGKLFWEVVSQIERKEIPVISLTHSSEEVMVKVGCGSLEDLFKFSKGGV